MGRVLFYHLTRSTVEETAATILTRALGAGWRVMVRGTDTAALAALDLRLWQGDAAEFLPHGLAGGPHDADQPVLLGTGAVGNAAQALMLVGGADFTADEGQGLERVWLLFDGADEAAVTGARTQWKRLTGAGLAAEYWAEDSGRWQMRTASPAPGI